MRMTDGFEAGSADLWVVSTSAETTGHPGFDGAKSSTFKNTTESTAIQYGQSYGTIPNGS